MMYTLSRGGLELTRAGEPPLRRRSDGADGGPHAPPLGESDRPHVLRGDRTGVGRRRLCELPKHEELPLRKATSR